MDDQTKLFLAVAAICYCAYRLFKKISEEDKAAAEAMRAKREAYEQEQALVRNKLNELIGSSTAAANSLKGLLQRAETAIDLADHEFKDGAFVPFWEAIEKGAKALATFDRNTQQLIENSKQFREVVKRLDSDKPQLALGREVIPDASHAAQRLWQIVRQAQKNFQFATIYQQCKTNKLLVSGFSSLGDAINGLGDRIVSSHDLLKAELTESHEIAAFEVVKELRQSNETVEKIQKRIAPDRY